MFYYNEAVRRRLRRHPGDMAVASIWPTIPPCPVPSTISCPPATPRATTNSLASSSTTSAAKRLQLYPAQEDAILELFAEQQRHPQHPHRLRQIARRPRPPVQIPLPRPPLLLHLPDQGARQREIPVPLPRARPGKRRHDHRRRHRQPRRPGHLLHRRNPRQHRPPRRRARPGGRRHHGRVPLLLRPHRGAAWQIPLLTLPRARFLLMSATLGDSSFFSKQLTALTGAPPPSSSPTNARSRSSSNTPRSRSRRLSRSSPRRTRRPSTWSTSRRRTRTRNDEVQLPKTRTIMSAVSVVMLAQSTCVLHSYHRGIWALHCHSLSASQDASGLPVW